MKKAKLRVTRITHSELIQQAFAMKQAILKNAALFPEIAAMVPKLDALLSPFVTVREDIGRMKAELRALESTGKSCRKKLEGRMSQIADYLSGIAQGNAGLILAAGVPTTNDRSPVIMTKVLNLRVTPGVNEGELLAEWKPVRRARMYEVQICAAEVPSPELWKFKDVISRSWCTLNHDLVSGSKVWVRVRACGSNNQGPWSDAIRKTVP